VTLGTSELSPKIYGGQLSTLIALSVSPLPNRRPNQTFSDLDEIAVAVGGHVVEVERQELEDRGTGRRTVTVEHPYALVAGAVVDGIVAEVWRRQQRRTGWTLRPSAHYKHAVTPIQGAPKT